MRMLQGLAMVAVLMSAGCIPFRIVRSDGNESSAPLSAATISAVRENSLPKFAAIEIQNAIDSKIVFGEKPGIHIEADSADLPYVQAEVSGNSLRVWYDRSGNHRAIHVKITTPSLGSLNVSGASAAKIEDWNQGDIKIHLSGASSLDASGDWDNVELTLEGASEATISAETVSNFITRLSGDADLTITGQAKKGEFILSGASKLDAEEFVVTTAMVDVQGASECRIDATDTITGKASGASRIATVNKPKNANITSSGASSVNTD